MRLERIERTGTREQVLREYQRRGMLVERGLPLIGEMCDALLLSEARKWLRVIEDERPASEHIAVLSSLIVRTTGDGQEHRSGYDSGGYWAIPERPHALMLWFDLFMLANRLRRPHARWLIDWRPRLNKLLPTDPTGLIPGEFYWTKRGDGSWLCCERVQGQMPRTGNDLFRPTDVSISGKGSVGAGAWCPPLPAFDHNLNAILTTAG